jgi:hypothetical protein
MRGSAGSPKALFRYGEDVSLGREMSELGHKWMNSPGRPSRRGDSFSDEEDERYATRPARAKGKHSDFFWFKLNQGLQILTAYIGEQKVRWASEYDLYGLRNPRYGLKKKANPKRWSIEQIDEAANKIATHHKELMVKAKGLSTAGVPPNQWIDIAPFDEKGLTDADWMLLAWQNTSTQYIGVTTGIANHFTPNVDLVLAKHSFRTADAVRELEHHRSLMDAYIKDLGQLKAAAEAAARRAAEAATQQQAKQAAEEAEMATTSKTEEKGEKEEVLLEWGRSALIAGKEGAQDGLAYGVVTSFTESAVKILAVEFPQLGFAYAHSAWVRRGLEVALPFVIGALATLGYLPKKDEVMDFCARAIRAGFSNNFAPIITRLTGPLMGALDNAIQRSMGNIPAAPPAAPGVDLAAMTQAMAAATAAANAANEAVRIAQQAQAAANEARAAQQSWPGWGSGAPAGAPAGAPTSDPAGAPATK